MVFWTCSQTQISSFLMNHLYGFIFILIGIPRETKNLKGCVVLDFFLMVFAL